MNLHPFKVLVASAACYVATSVEATDAGECVTTEASGAVLPEPFPASERWYGSETLAVMLPDNGIWRGMGAQHRYRDKLFWWSYGFRPGAESHLSVRGRRLDGDSPPANLSRSTNAHSPSLGGWAMLVAVEFPSTGCWEITGEYLGQKLSFVVNVLDD